MTVFFCFTEPPAVDDGLDVRHGDGSLNLEYITIIIHYHHNAILTIYYDYLLFLF